MWPPESNGAHHVLKKKEVEEEEAFVFQTAFFGKKKWSSDATFL